MRRMNTRQATGLMTFLLALPAFITACFPSNLPTPTRTLPTSTPSRTATATPSPTPEPTGTPTLPACLTQPGTVDQGLLETTKPPQGYFIYLPPCYAEKMDQRYPVL